MGKIFVISDTHFSHGNIIKFCNRPFSDIYDMNETLLKNWNAVVSNQDKVYHLGDVYMNDTSKEYMNDFLGRLNGKKRLILGNHDSGKDPLLQKHFQKIDVWRMFTEYNILLTHVPVHPSTLKEGRFTGQGKKQAKMINVHGHIHTNKSPIGPYKCVCVEQVDYMPIEITKLTK